MKLISWNSMMIGLFSSVLISMATESDTTDLDDAEIASVAVVANQIDIDYAEIAQKRSRDAEVLQFARTMENDHKAVIEQATALVKKLGVTPKDNVVSQQLLDEAEKTGKTLKSLSKKAFNRVYIDNEVAYHRSVISAVETLLIPNAQNLELKSFLQNILPALKTHLAHAQMLQKKYN